MLTKRVSMAPRESSAERELMFESVVRAMQVEHHSRTKPAKIGSSPAGRRPRRAWYGMASRASCERFQAVLESGFPPSYGCLIGKGTVMNWKTSVLWVVLAGCFAGAAAGCNKPGEPEKNGPAGKSSTTKAVPAQAPANTTDSK
jgi:hypothetical protein